MYPFHLARPSAVPVSPVVWSLGFTSLFTDLSSEMVTSTLPVYLFLHLHLSPFAFGVIDGIQNGLAAALLGIAAALLADRTLRHKSVALAGYGLSALSKLILLLLGGLWAWMLTFVALDRIGKGIRTAPRDALISLHTDPGLYASAFAVHRALDAGGALLGPIAAFALLSLMPGGFEIVWFASLVAAIIGFAVLWLFVPQRSPIETRHTAATDRTAWLAPVRSVRVTGLAFCGLLLALFTISDAFIYLLLHRRSGTPAGVFPLFFVGTACAYMISAVPLGRLADRIGRPSIFLLGFGALLALYTVLLQGGELGVIPLVGCLALLGFYYAATEGTLMAMASLRASPEARTTGIAVVAAAVGLGKVLSSIVFGWLWSAYGASMAVAVFAVALIVAVLLAASWLRTSTQERLSHA